MKELKPLDKLVKARKEKNWTQDVLAKKAKISRPFLSHIERGYATATLPVAYRIAKALDMSIEELFFARNVRKTNIKTA